MVTGHWSPYQVVAAPRRDVHIATMYVSAQSGKRVREAMQTIVSPSAVGKVSGLGDGDV